MKKIQLYTLIISLASILLFSQCSDFGDTNVNPNVPPNPDTRFLYLGVIRESVPYFYITSTYDPFNQIYPQYFSERTNIQFTTFASQMFSTGAYYYNALNNIDQIIKLNTNESTRNEAFVQQFGSSNNNQIALVRTLRAYIYMHLTDCLGMIPYFDAIKALDGNFRPKFDDQQAIYNDLEKELNEAYAQFDETRPLNSNFEIIYRGDISKWKKFNASVRMMLSIKLFKADPANGKARFAKAYANGFIRNNNEIFQYPYYAESDNQNPLYDNMMVSQRRDFSPSGTIVNLLMDYNDPRLSAYAAPNKYGTYYGVPFGLTKEAAGKINADTVSNFNPKYYKQNSPAVLVTPSIMLFAAAEAAERAWITDNAEDLYKEAIKAAFEQHDISVADNFDTYYNQPSIKYTGTSAEKIAKIATQKWIASYLQDGFEAWADWRRLGVPDLKPGPNAVEGLTHIPFRRIYHTDDYNANIDNYKAAIAIQGPDNFETKVWWNK